MDFRREKIHYLQEQIEEQGLVLNRMNSRIVYLSASGHVNKHYALLLLICDLVGGHEVMAIIESVIISISIEVSKYIKCKNPEMECLRNAFLLYPYILNQTISHDQVVEIIGIEKFD